jgi:hypothetical protein
LFIIGAVCFICLGIIVITKSGLYNYGYHIDFTGYNILAGSIFILIGILFIWSEIRKRIKKKE